VTRRLRAAAAKRELVRTTELKCQVTCAAAARKPGIPGGPRREIKKVDDRRRYRVHTHPSSLRPWGRPGPTG
jgi:hypothetical protein